MDDSPRSYNGYTGLANLWQFLLVLVAGIAISLPIILLPRERYVKLFAEHFGWIPVVFGAFTYPYWFWYASDQIDVGFFQTAAQVLPVLLLASIIDIRRSSVLKTDQLALPLLGVFLGEIAALNESAFHDAAYQVGATRTDFAVVASSLVVSIVALIMAVMANLEENETKIMAKPGTSGDSQTREDKEEDQRNINLFPRQIRILLRVHSSNYPGRDLTGVRPVLIAEPAGRRR